ncbi:MAG TPA: HAMP domain-containing sensor histidine kinase [Longimicrobium sp.]|jgi:signal transduction histidine kinase
MRLRQRIVLTLVAIIVILAIPAAYAVLQLSALKGIAGELKARDTRATSELGKLRAQIEALQSAEDNVVALARVSPEFTSEWRATGDTVISVGDTLVASLRRRPHSSARYRAAVTDAERQWTTLKTVVREEQARIAGGEFDVQQVFRKTRVTPAFNGMIDRLEPISNAIEEESQDRVRRAEAVARQALTTTGIALAVALALTVAIGVLMARAMLRPIEELGKGMAHVAEGDFEPNVHVPTERPDEIGDLARSFATMTEQLAELDRLKAEFVSVASHEIKTPLSVIRGYVSLLADGIYGEINDAQKKTLEAVSDQVDRLTRLVHRLLDISRFEAGGGRLEVRRINVRDFLEELTGGFRVLAFQNGIDFTVRVADDVPVNLEGDADRLNEVLGNILSNAFKFTQRGGRISLDAQRDGAGLVVEVRDTGVGIPADKLPKIFEKFYQVDNAAQPRSVGSGLGLAIAREIVEAHGGTIGAESEVGKGTMFRVSLPDRPPAPRAAEPHAGAVRK